MPLCDLPTLWSDRACSPTRNVPPGDHGGLSLVAQHADRRRLQGEASATVRGEIDPPRGQDPKDVPVGEQRDVASCGSGLGDQSIGPPAHLVGGFPSRYAVRPHGPPRARGPDGSRGPALELAVVPFAEVIANLHGTPQPCEPTGLSG